MALTGMDIASYQASLNLANVGGDFVIIKATEGTRYVNPYCDKHYQQAKAANKLRGVYHFARNRSNSAAAEARHFVSNIKGYIRDAVLVLDWEDGSGVADVAWAKAWLDTVTQLTGVRPMIYMSASPASQYAWETVAKDYGLWIAGYPTSKARGLEAPDCPYRPGHNWKVAMWQYTSSGRVSGYGGNLDLNVFYGDRAAWLKYAGATATTTAATASTSTAAAKPAVAKTSAAAVDITGIQRAVHTTVDNIVGKQTRTAVSLVAQASRWGGTKFPNGVAATQRAVGATPDGIWGPGSKTAHDNTVKAIQTALGKLGYRLDVDGIWGPATEKAVTDALNRGRQA
ncbi:GH25 family lysozyme [Actinomyces ruminicola]|uniref:GH25 family lysozyme n=1 Tax=Actinomyces ruminicola TaxID=332524 RepID=UPI0011CBF951|nr:GH25 family lysozyme [Actinomyces ruminicola]